MRTAVLIGLITVSALTCPVMMLIGRRRGSRMPCRPPINTGRDERADELRRRQIALSGEILRRSEQALVEKPTGSLP